jgi:IS30 family transposase
LHQQHAVPVELGKECRSVEIQLLAAIQPDQTCGFNRSMQHLSSNKREEDVADEEIPKEDSLHRNRQRTRSRRALSIAEREEISRGVVADRSLRLIATSLNRAPSRSASDRLRLRIAPYRAIGKVINALIKQAHKLPRELYKSLTWDRGKEMADHKRFTLDTDIKVYFCDPQSPWQRGSNENTNGLLRQYFPKGMDLSNVHQNRLNAVARRLNERPRETLNFETPAERFNQCVASTG